MGFMVKLKSLSLSVFNLLRLPAFPICSSKGMFFTYLAQTVQNRILSDR